MSNPYDAPKADLSEEPSDDVYQPRVWALKGRIGRLRYMAYSLGQLVVLMVAMGLLVALLGQASMVLVGAAALLANIPFFAIIFILARRRLNDLNFSGWFSLLYLIPVIGVALFPTSLTMARVMWIIALAMFACLVLWPGKPLANDFGPRPGPNSIGVVIGALILPVLFGLGVVAAVSVPAYTDYLLRARGRAAPAPVMEPASALPAASQ